MSGNQMPVLTLDFDDEKIKKLNDIADKFRAALSIGPGGTPFPGAPAPSPTLPVVPKPKTTGKNNPPQTAFDKFLKKLNKDAQSTLKTFRLINKTLTTTTATLKGLFTTTVTWSARVAALSTGSAFGYSYMTGKVADQYRTSQGMGITTGQMQAARNVYGTRFSNAEGIMQSLANAQNDPSSTQYAGLMSMGINPRDGVAANMPKLMSSVASLLKQYKGTGVDQAVINSRGLGGIIDVATANQILANSDRFPQLNQQFAEQSRLLDQNMGGGTQQSYQDLSARLGTNVDRIGNSFLKALAKLNGPLGRLSDNLTASVEKFLNGRNGQALFDMLASGLQKVGDWLGSDDFQSDLKTFAECIKVIIRALGDAINWIAGNVSGVNLSGTGIGKDSADSDLVSFGNKYLGGQLPGANPLTGKYTGIFTEEKAREGFQMPDALKGNIQNFVAEANKTAGLPAGLMSAIANKESHWNPLARNKGSGAAGMFQFMPGTARAYGLNGDDVYDPNKSTIAAARYLKDLSGRYDGDVAKMLTSYNGGRIDKNGNLSLKSETVDYLMKILPQVQGAVEQHPNILWQLNEARQNLSRGGKDDRATIQLEIVKTPGSDIQAQVLGQTIPR